jgi:hypothetical protein
MTPSFRRSIATLTPPVTQGLLFGVFTAALLVLLEQLSLRLGLSESQRIVDDLAGGLIAGLIVFFYARVRTSYIEERLKTVELMNHHIRNALQVIRHAGYIQPEGQQVAEVENAIDRIDWALREILTGRVTDYDDDHEGKPGSSAAA